MLTVEELRHLAASLPRGAFEQQLGPFALIQRPPPSEKSAGLTLKATEIAPAGAMAESALGLLFEFDGLIAATLPPLTKAEAETLTVGRLPDSDLVLEDASVSKRHAVLTWDGAAGRCSVRDLDSTNGTLLNAGTRIRGEVVLRDGDILSFGDVQFWFLLSGTLFDKLRSRGPTGLGSRSG